MEINLGNSFGGSMGVKPEMSGVGVEDVRRTAATDASEVSRLASNLTVSDGIADISSAEPTAKVTDAELRRDDALGMLISAAFNLPPPQMPAFM